MPLLIQESGLSRWMGNQLTPLHSIPPWAIAIVLCLLISTFTECTSNVATATLFLPVLASMVRTTWKKKSWWNTLQSAVYCSSKSSRWLMWVYPLCGWLSVKTNIEALPWPRSTTPDCLFIFLNYFSPFERPLYQTAKFSSSPIQPAICAHRQPNCPSALPKLLSFS